MEIPYLEKSISVSPSITSMPNKVPALEEESEPAGYSLLVVEDTTDMLEFLAKNLGNTYTIHTAANGKGSLGMSGDNNSRSYYQRHRHALTWTDLNY